MTTVARHLDVAGNEEGQSVFEFLLMLPVMIGLVVILVEVNTAIQMSIVDQQYARSMATFLAFNSPIYPESTYRSSELDQKGYNQMIIGVMDQPLANGTTDAHPQASIETITRRRDVASVGSNASQQEPTQRTDVRIRDTVSLCTQSEVILAGGQRAPILDPLNPGIYNLPDSPSIDWQYCHSGIQMYGSAIQ